MSAELHDTDFFAWTRDQAARLRQLSDEERIDAEILAEEIEALGSSDFHAVESYLERIIEHLLRLQFSGLDLHVDHWRNEIDTFRVKFEDRVTPSMRTKLSERIDRRYRVACNRARNALKTSVPDIATRLPECCPYSLEQILNADWFPKSQAGP
ncbi:MAG: DUF29 family protein [Alphaproteobacteria bacterium]|jgi:hypothetical protein|nr:DUF29 family protein [Alphaproteobacteria bacterium]